MSELDNVKFRNVRTREELQGDINRESAASSTTHLSDVRDTAFHDHDSDSD